MASASIKVSVRTTETRPDGSSTSTTAKVEIPLQRAAGSDGQTSGRAKAYTAPPTAVRSSVSSGGSGSGGDDADAADASTRRPFLLVCAHKHAGFPVPEIEAISEMFGCKIQRDPFNS